MSTVHVSTEQLRELQEFVDPSPIPAFGTLAQLLSPQQMTVHERVLAVDEYLRQGHTIRTARTADAPAGTIWTDREPTGGNSWNHVAFGDGRFVAVNNTVPDAPIMTSPDGLIWTTRNPIQWHAWNAPNTRYTPIAENLRYPTTGV